MADLALTILQPLIERLSSEIWRQLGLLRGLKGDLNKLKSTLEDINVVLYSAEQRAKTDDRVRRWLWELKDVAYDADDVLDDVQVEVLRRSSSSNRPITAEVHDFFSSKNQIAFRFKIAKKIKEINARLNDIEEKKKIFNFPVSSNSEVSVTMEVTSSRERETFSRISKEDEFFGRDDDRKKVMTFLLEKDNDKQLSVLPIVGLGGVGKTTLAKMVFNDERINEQFEPLIWVCVSENFKLSEVIKKIIHNVKQETYPLSELENMQRELVKIIGGKRFFLVLDDVWDDGDLSRADQDLGWEALKSLISCGGSGSKVIVTTRDHEVARVTGTLQYSHELESLEFDDCWNLFCERAFRKESPPPTPWMEAIGKQIVEKCGGLPLAAKSLGGLMGSKQEESEWIAIRDSEIWEIKEEDGVHILPALRLSYLHLPFHLKQCFVYCSLFPKDYEFVMKELIELWITEGFISSAGAAGRQMHPKDIGSRYFRILLRQSFFQETGVIYSDDFGEEIVEYTMHDLVHDLACFIAGPEFAFQGKLTREPEKWRYLSIDLGGHLPETERRGIINQISKARKLRSFISVSPIPEACYIEILSGLPYLRVLHLQKLEDKEVITALQNTIPRLKHLRLLHLLNSLIETLPEAITNLHSLQVLNLSDCYQLRKLPRDMSKLTNLRILEVDEVKICAKFSRLGRLSKLEKIPMFIIGTEPGRTIAELQQLNMLRGFLIIFGLAKVKDAEEAKKANLIAKTSLRHLMLTWEDVDSDSDISEPDGSEERGKSGNIIDRMNSLVRSCCRARFASDKEEEEEAAPSPTDEDTIKNHVLDSLQPPPYIEELSMESYDGTRFPSWMTRIELLSRYENLIRLYLSDIKRCEFLPPLGKLPRLENLEIGEMPCLKQIGSEFYGDRRGGGVIFPSLKFLEISECPNLTAWKEWLEPDLDRNGSLIAPSLRIVTIYGCPNLTALPEWLEVAPDSDTYHMVRIAGATYYRRRQCRVVAGETEDAATAREDSPDPMFEQPLLHSNES